MHEIVLNQIPDEDPPATTATAARLRSLAYDRHEVLHMLASVVAGKLWGRSAPVNPPTGCRIEDVLNALAESWERRRR